MPDPIQTYFHPRSVPSAFRRKKLFAVDVPANEAGLQRLAAEGNWDAVVVLAETLEQQAPTIRQQQQFVLARITAHVKMNEYSKAMSIVDKLGDLNDSKYVENGCSVLPFSTLFLHAALPMYNSNCPQALMRLYDLSKRSEAARAAAADDPNSVSGWVARCHRIKRAIALCHFECGQGAMALETLKQISDEAVDDVTQLIMLQQVGCLALRCGNVTMAAKLFKSLAHVVDDEDLNEEELEIKKVIIRSSSALLEMFFGRANEAIKKLDEVVAPLLASSYPDAETPPKPLSTVVYLRLLAANAMVVCHQFSLQPDKAIANSLNVLQDLTKRFPQVLAFVPLIHNLFVLIQMDGDEINNKKQTLEILVDAFITTRNAFPRVLK